MLDMAVADLNRVSSQYSPQCNSSSSALVDSHFAYPQFPFT